MQPTEAMVNRWRPVSKKFPEYIIEFNVEQWEYGNYLSLKGISKCQKILVEEKHYWGGKEILC